MSLSWREEYPLKQGPAASKRVEPRVVFICDRAYVINNRLIGSANKRFLEPEKFLGQGRKEPAGGPGAPASSPGASPST
jgi:hypothetical protein